MYTYRISIGDIEVPNVDVWETALGENNSKFMLYLTWVIWMVNQYILLIVLMNFLIAIISQVYEDDMTNKLENEYVQKAEMNLESQQVLSTIHLIKKYSFYILSGPKQDKADEDI